MILCDLLYRAGSSATLNMMNCGWFQVPGLKLSAALSFTSALLPVGVTTTSAVGLLRRRTA